MSKEWQRSNLEILLTLLGLIAVALLYGGCTPSREVRAEPPSVLERRLDRLEREEERRHGEVLTRIESLRRQVLRLHGRGYAE